MLPEACSFSGQDVGRLMLADLSMATHLLHLRPCHRDLGRQPPSHGPPKSIRVSSPFLSSFSHNLLSPFQTYHYPLSSSPPFHPLIISTFPSKSHVLSFSPFFPSSCRHRRNKPRHKRQQHLQQYHNLPILHLLHPTHQPNPHHLAARAQINPTFPLGRLRRRRATPSSKAAAAL